MEIEWIAVDEVIPYENNPRKNEASIDKVAASIKEFGFKQPIVIDKSGVIVVGHTRLEAAKQLGWEKVPCIRANDLTDEQAKAYRLADNKVGESSEWEFNLLGEELGSIFEIDMSEFGFEEITLGGYGTDFLLPDGEKPEICQMTFTLHEEQKDQILRALDAVGEPLETFGNTNKNGNALYEVVRQWAEQRI